jgi:hypothetical protein
LDWIDRSPIIVGRVAVSSRVAVLLLMCLAATTCGGETANGELADATALREAFEETGVAFDLCEGSDEVWCGAAGTDRIVVEGDPVVGVTVQLENVDPGEIDASGSFPGSVYFDVLEDAGVPGLKGWVVDEIRNGLPTPLQVSRQFGPWEAVLGAVPEANELALTLRRD